MAHYRHGEPILIRSDSAGRTYGLLAHIRGLRDTGVDARFSVGVAITEPIRQAILAMKDRPGDWMPALDGHGQPRNGSIQFLEARHRGYARVEDRIGTGEDTGFGCFPSRVFAINQAWLQITLTGVDLLAWTQMLLCHGDLATAEPKKLLYRLLHAAAGSPARPDEPGYASPKPGPGQQNSPTRSPASPPCPDRSADLGTPHRQPRWSNPARGPGQHHAHPPIRRQEDQLTIRPP